MEIVERTKIEDVRRINPETIFYGAMTCWWTHRDENLCTSKDGLPCDPRGGVLLETNKVKEFLEAAEKNPAHYGKHGLRTFMAANHDNCQVSLNDERRTCARTWVEYNDALDKLDKRLK